MQNCIRTILNHRNNDANNRMNSSGFILLFISPRFAETTKNENDGKVISGFFEAHTTNTNKDNLQFKGQFLNVSLTDAG